MKGAGRAAFTGEKRNACKACVWKLVGKRPLGKARRRCLKLFQRNRTGGREVD